MACVKCENVGVTGPIGEQRPFIQDAPLRFYTCPCGQMWHRCLASWYEVADSESYRIIRLGGPFRVGHPLVAISVLKKQRSFSPPLPVRLRQ
jgi:hypothetical protein